MNLGRAKVVDRVLGSALGLAVGTYDAARELVQSPAPVDRVEHVLVSKFWGLGNWALLRPVVRDLRARWSGARMTIATLACNAPLVGDLADELILIHATGFGASVGDLVRGVGRLRRRPPDLAVDFEQFSRAGGLLARLGGARQRVGFRTASRGRDGLYTVLVPFASDVHVSESFRRLAEAAGVEPGRYRPGGLEVGEAAQRAVTAMVGAGPCVVLHPGSGDNFPGRRWSEAGFAATGRAAVEAGRRVFVTGSRVEAPLASRVARAVGEGAQSVAGDLRVPELIALLAHADALIANDTGPVHLASALGTPVLALFGPNTPRLYGPLSPRSRSFYRGLPCSPCLTVRNYRSSRCRIHTCMASIRTGEVVTALGQLLDGIGGEQGTRDARGSARTGDAT